jgi:WD40 repeat protein/transcriptional regulator with XRE-family HTH domain
LTSNPRLGFEPADPDRIATQQDFGKELSILRNRAELTVREVARAVGAPASTIGDYFAGRHLPPALDLLSRVLAVCGEADEAQIDQWVAALQRARRVPGPRPASARPPYRGLASFQPEDAEWYFGREELTQSLVALVTDGDGSGVPLMVVGPSGSGKSSLLRAGLIPALRTQRFRGRGGTDRSIALLTPGTAPVDALATCLTPGTRNADSAEVLRSAPGQWVHLAAQRDELPQAIVVDQLEETWAACSAEDERLRFIAALSALSDVSAVVLGLRADFYGHALRHPELATALQQRQIVVGPVTRGQLRRAIIEPARHAKLDVEDGLVELLLRDLMPHPGLQGHEVAHEPGALPLLSHALLSTWGHSRGARLTVADYEATGGIRNAIAQTAETVYQELTTEEQAIARHLFLRLVHVTDGITETRRRVTLGTVTGRSANGAQAAEVLSRFVDYRLITVSDETAEVSHEALLGAWPRLREWIDADRAGLQIRRRIEEGARAWQDTGREVSALPRGGQLAITRDWAADPVNRDSLSEQAAQFVDAGMAHERAEQEARRRTTRRLRQLVAALTALVLVTAGVTGYAWEQRQAANTARNVADSRELAIEASQLRSQDVSLASQLSLAAYQTSRTPEALASVLDSSGTPAAARLIDSADIVESVALSPNRAVLAVAAADGTLRLWDVAQADHATALGRPLEDQPDSPLYAVAISPNGLLLAAAGAGQTIRLWNLSDPRHPTPLGAPLTGPDSTVYSIAFSPNSRTLAVGDYDGTARMWDVADPGHAQPLPALAGATGAIQAVAFSPNGQLLAAGSTDKDVQLWSVADPQHPVMLGRPLTEPAFSGLSGTVTGVAFSPDSRMLAASSQDNQIWLWNITNPARPVDRRSFTGATDWANAVAFSPDGSIVAAGSSDDTVRLWNLASGRLIATLPEPGIITSLAWDNDHLLAAGGADGSVRFWSLPPPVLDADGPVNDIAYSPNGGVLAVASNDLELWDAVTRTRIATATVPGTFIDDVAYSPKGAMMATGTGDGMIQLWTTRGKLAPLGPSITATTTGVIESVAFSPSGRILASGADDGTVRLWNISNPGHPVLLTNRRDSADIVFSVGFSPDGRTLAAASGDDLTRLWNVTRPADPVPLGKPLKGTTSYDISVAFSPNGHTLAIGSADKTLRMWNITDPVNATPIGRPLTGPEGYVYSVAFSANGRMIAEGSTDDTVWVWNVTDPASPALMAELTGTAGHVYSVDFSPSGQALAAGSADGTVRLWDTNPAPAATAICAAEGEPITRMEWARYDPGQPYAPPCTGRT